MFTYGFLAGSVIPMSIVYVMRPESLGNLFEFFSSSLFIAMTWSEDVTERFNLTHELFTPTLRPSAKMYNCYNIDFWYRALSWTIYLCFISSLITFILNQRWKNSVTFLNDPEGADAGTDFVFYYFCIFVLAMLSICLRTLVEYHLLGRLKPSTIAYFMWYTVSFALVCLWNR